jgi:hypothetical protein
MVEGNRSVVIHFLLFCAYLDLFTWPFEAFYLFFCNNILLDSRLYQKIR